jgi:hypothetical protein
MLLGQYRPRSILCSGVKAPLTLALEQMTLPAPKWPNGPRAGGPHLSDSYALKNHCSG